MTSLLLVEAGEPAPDLQAGPDGASVLILQFPAPTDRPGSHADESAGERTYKLPEGITAS